MKKVFLILFVFFGIRTGFAEKGEPIRDYNENGYTLESAKTFAMTSEPLPQVWRENFLSILNNAFKKAGIETVLTDSHIEWAFQHIRYEVVELQNYSNTKRYGDSLVFFTDPNRFHGEVAVFYFKNSKASIRVIVYKTACQNLLKIEPEVKLLESPVVTRKKLETIRDTEMVRRIVIGANTQSYQFRDSATGRPIVINVTNTNVNNNDNSCKCGGGQQAATSNDGYVYRQLPTANAYVPQTYYQYYPNGRYPNYGYGYGGVPLVSLGFSYSSNNTPSYASGGVVNPTPVNSTPVTPVTTGGPAGVPGFGVSNTGGPSGVNGFGNTGGPSGLNGFGNTGGPAGVSGFGATSGGPGGLNGFGSTGTTGLPTGPAGVGNGFSASGFGFP